MADTREITRLRKAGQLDDAIRLARQAYAESPNDVWVIRAIGWAFHDCLKRAEQARNIHDMRMLLQEFSVITIPPGNDDATLRGARETWRTKIPAHDNVTPLADLLKTAKVASDAGNRQEALRLCRDARRLYPNAPQASTSLGWEIERELKDLVAKEEIDARAVRDLLNEYYRIPNIEKPGNLHALILTRAAQAAAHERFPTFIRFFRWWDPANLRPDDFERFTPKDSDKSFDSRVELVIRGIHKASEAENDQEDIIWAAGFVAQHYEKFTEQEWFPYYYGQLLVKTGDLVHARQLITPIVRRKRRDFWSWHTLAATYTPNEVEQRLACLCMSLLCHAQEERFLVNVHAELGELLAATGMYDAAKYEIDRSIAIREAQKPKPWKTPQRLKELQSSAWYAQTAATKSNKPLYEQHAPAAEALIFEGLPELHAILTHQLPPSDDKPGVSFIGYHNHEKLEETRVKTKHFECLHHAEIGSPLTIQIDESAESSLVVAIRPRDGTLWDLIPDKVGVVRHVNRDKGVTSVALSRDDFCLLYHDRFPQAAVLHSGHFVAVKLRKDPKHDKTISLAFSVTDNEPSAEFFRRFQGAFDQIPDRQFGFVNDGGLRIFVPPDLIAGATFAGGVSVRGTAVFALEKAKNRYGWSAVSIELAQGNQPQ